jgi:hypothetical protein
MSANMVGSFGRCINSYFPGIRSGLASLKMGGTQSTVSSSGSNFVVSGVRIGS